MTSTLAARPLQASAGGRVLTQDVHGNLLTDYICASGNTSLQFTDVPLDPNVLYIFPLSFAIDADVNGNQQNGVFSPYWASSLSPDAASSFVQANGNVQLAVSLAGATQFVNGQNLQVNWYDPADTNAWINNAVMSITSLAQQYSLTGVDIDYENFPNGAATFTQCIGGLITQLKNNNPNFVVSIAPFGNTLSIYADLYANFGSAIDHINYQFYADGLMTQSDYVNRYNTVVPSFDTSKMLMSVEVEGRGLQGSDFVAAAQQVQIAGIMIFDVDTSKEFNFATENVVAAYLAT